MINVFLSVSFLYWWLSVKIYIKKRKNKIKKIKKIREACSFLRSLSCHNASIAIFTDQSLSSVHALSAEASSSQLCIETKRYSHLRMLLRFLYMDTRTCGNTRKQTGWQSCQGRDHLQLLECSPSFYNPFQVNTAG